MTSGSKSLSIGDKIRLIAPLVIYAVLAFVAWKRGYFREQAIAEVVGGNGSLWAAVTFVLIYSVVGALALPVTPLGFAAGAVFGFWPAATLVWVASMLAAVAGYYLAQGVWAEPARRLLGRYEGMHDLGESNAFLTALRVRLMPLIPFGAFSYAAAISKLSLPPVLAGTALGIIPATLLTVFIGDRFAAGVHGASKKPYLLAIAAALALLALSFAPKLWEKRKTPR